jgi:hypothetical protein
MSANARKERSVVCVARVRVRVNKQTNATLTLRALSTSRGALFRPTITGIVALFMGSVLLLIDLSNMFEQGIRDLSRLM